MNNKKDVLKKELKEAVSDWWDSLDPLGVELAKAVFGICVTLGLLLGAANYIFRAECYAKTERMGFEMYYSAMAGCMIEVTDGQWIPLDSYYFKEE